MTDERTHGNGYNLSTGASDDDEITSAGGRTWHYVGGAVEYLDGDDYTWDDDDDGDAWASEDAWVLMEQKLQQAERTIAELREERDIVSSMTVVVYVLVAVMFGALGYLARMVQGWIW